MRRARQRDVMTPEQRSRCMSRIKGSNTGPELMLRRALWVRGWRYRLRTNVLGHPDLVFKGQKLVVFIDGCFWHGCKIHGVSPRSNRQFWENKLRANIVRDQKVTTSLRRAGWKVMRFWGHDIDNHLERVVLATERQLNKKKRGRKD